MKRVLVTGGRGFIGRHVLSALDASGYDVHAVTSGVPPDQGSVVWHRGDLLDQAQRIAIVRAVGAEGLVHLAWCAKPPRYWNDPDNIGWAAATLDLVRAFAEAGGSRVVGAGSCAEYDWQHGYCVERLTPVAPRTLYGTAKAACGSLLDAFGAEAGISIAWGRLFFLFGPGDSPERLIPSVIDQLLGARTAHVRTAGHVRDFLYVADAAAALGALLHSTVTGPVNIGSGVARRVGDVAEAVAAKVGRRDLLRMDEGPAEDAFVVASVARLRDEVGWRPRFSFEAALDLTLDARMSNRTGASA